MIEKMLKENTGCHFLDSGGVNNRHWQRNQDIDFKNQEEGWIEFYYRDGRLEIIPTLSLYHFLSDKLEHNEELTKKYQKFCEKHDLFLDCHSAEDFAEDLGGKGIYGDDGPFIVNSYNEENLLSQDIQFVYWKDDGEHILLQIHGGCDICGGYTDPVAFDLEDQSIFRFNQGVIYCEKCGENWTTDSEINLEEYTVVEEKPIYFRQSIFNQKLLFPTDTLKTNTYKIWVENNNGHCPCCGGLLKLGAY